MTNTRTASIRGLLLLLSTFGVMTGVSAQSVPQPPSGLMASIAGSTVTWVWQPSATGGVEAYVLEAGSAPGASNLGRFRIGTAAAYVAANVGAGTYYVRVRGANSVGESAPSNEIIVTVGSSGCPGLPTAPGPLMSSVSGSSVQLSWGGSAGTVSTYVFEIGSRAQASDLGTIELGTTGTSYRADGVASGTYFVRVRARNACGLSAPSNDTTVVIGGPPSSGGPRLQVINSNAYTVAAGDYAGQLVVAGEVTNTGGAVASLVWVNVEKFAPGGSRLGGIAVELVGKSRRITESQQIERWTLGPGETGCFAITMGAASTIGRHQIQVNFESFPTTELKGGPLDVAVRFGRGLDFNRQIPVVWSTPEMSNHGLARTAWNRVAYVFKDDAGRVLGCNSVAVYGKTNAPMPGLGVTNVLLPGETGHTLNFKEITNFEINVLPSSVRAWPQWKE